MKNRTSQDPWESLIENINQGKIPHAVLLHGSSLPLLSHHSRKLASHILLKDHPEAQYKISQNLHPDIYEFFPAGKGRLHTIEIPREIKRNIAIFPFEGNYKVYILHEVDRMVLPAISIFLKVLEDAPSHSVIILTTTKLQSLPATLISRSLVLHIRGEDLPSLTPEEMTYLFAYASGGMKITESGKIVKGTSDADKQALRDKAKLLLEVLLKLFRDRFILALNMSASALSYPQYAEEIFRLPLLPLEKVLVIIETACQALHTSSSASSCMEWVALQLLSLRSSIKDQQDFAH